MAAEAAGADSLGLAHLKPVTPPLCLPPRPAQVLAKFGGEGSGMGKSIPGSASPFLVLHNPPARASYSPPPQPLVSVTSWRGAPIVSAGQPHFSNSTWSPSPSASLERWDGGHGRTGPNRWNCAQALPGSLGPRGPPALRSPFSSFFLMSTAPLLSPPATHTSWGTIQASPP